MERGNGFKLKEGGFRLDFGKKYFAVDQISIRNYGCPIPRIVQSQAGRGIEQPGLVKGRQGSWK